MLRYYELRSYLLLAMIINLKRRKSPVICSWMEAWIQNSLQNKTNAYNTNVKISDLMNIWGACHLFTLYLKGQWIKLNILLEVLASNEYVRRPGVTEQPIRGHFYDLTWWTWCLAPPLQFPDTRSSIEIRYDDFFGYLKTAFYSSGLGVCCHHCSLGQNNYRLHNVYGVSKTLCTCSRENPFFHPNTIKVKTIKHSNTENETWIQ